RSRLDWFKANNPSPIYYRNMPSYYENPDGGAASEEEISELINMWQNDQSFSQIDWTDIYNQNYNRQGGGAAYVLAADVNEDQTVTFATNLKSQISENFKLIAGLNYQNTTSELYREVVDLLGGSYFVNYNAFQRSYYNVDEATDRRIYEGDKYQYNYVVNHSRGDVFAQGEYSLNQFDFTLGLRAAYTSVYREGEYRHEQYLENTKGKSKSYDLLDLGAKAQVMYKLNGRNFFQLNTMYATYAPTVDEIFPNARSNDYTVDDNNFVQDGDNLKSSKV